MERLVTATEMSAILGVSKTRLYGLIRAGILPAPKRNPANNRGFWTTELTEVCRQVLQTRVGVNGQPYTPNRKAKRGSSTTTPQDRYESLIASLSALGITATSKQVDDAVKSLPDAGKGLEEGDLVKQVFLALRRKP